MADLPRYKGAERPHLSHSRVMAYLACGHQYFLRYVEKREGPKRARLAFGRAAHAAVAEDLRSKQATGRDFGYDQMRDTFRQQLASEMDGVELDRKEVEEFVTPRRAQDKLKTQGDEILMTFLDVAAPTIEPVSVEELVRIPTSEAYDLVVIPDVLEPDAAGDLKFGKASHDADQNLQLTIEALAFAQRNEGRLPSRVYLEVYKRGAVAKRERLESTRTVGDVETLTRVFGAAARGIAEDVFLPNALGSWRCTACDYGPESGDNSCEFARKGAR